VGFRGLGTVHKFCLVLDCMFKYWLRKLWFVVLYHVNSLGNMLGCGSEVHMFASGACESFAEVEVW
jgi:hypothetical protein